MDELRLAVRRLLTRPAATIASIVTLACAIGAAAATWSLLSAVSIRPLPVHDPDRLLVLGERMTSSRLQNVPPRYDAFVYPFYPAIRDSGIFESVVAHWRPAMRLLTRAGDGRSFRSVEFVSHDFFDVLRVAIPVGRGFAPDEDRPGAPPTAILSHACWQTAFGASPQVLGTSITIADRPVTIVGVAARGFRGLDLTAAPDIFLPLHTIADVGSPFTNYFADPKHRTSPAAAWRIVARLARFDDTSRALTRLGTLPPAWGRSKPAFALTPVNAAAVPHAAIDGMARFTVLLAATVAMLLLIGCSSVGMLLLLRTEARRAELATCMALGASRGRLARGVALEGLALAVAGALLSLPLASWLFAAIRTFRLPGAIDLGSLELSVGAGAIAAAVAGALMATLLIALLAIVVGFPTDVSDALRARAGATPQTTRRTVRTIVVPGQVAVALVLVAGAGLFARSVAAALTLNPGLDSGRIITASVELAPFGYTAPRAARLFDGLLERLKGNPAIGSLSETWSQGGFGGATLVIDGVSRKMTSYIGFTAIDNAYLRTLRIGLVEGREFSTDDVAGAPLVAIVSQSFGRMVAGGKSPIGVRITMPYSRPPAPPPVVEIVGVVPDVIVRTSALHPADLYLPAAQASRGTGRDLVVRAAGDPDAARREILGAVRHLDSTVSAGPMLTIDQRLLREMAPQRLGAFVLGGLGFLATLLTLMGTYALTDAMAARRLREMGIRSALGASGRQVATLVLSETARLVGVGLAAGYAVAWLSASTIRALLFQIEPLDPVTLIGTSGLISVLALAVSLRPALRAARVDLASVLRTE
jgi:predicted permease